MSLKLKLRPGKLFLVGTPIGNLADLSPRAKMVLEKVDVVFCEDTRRWRNLVKGTKIKPKAEVFSFFKDRESRATKKAIEFLKQGKDVALVSDAGMPLLADPGYILVSSCRKLGIEVRAIPGPSAFLLALVSSGLPCSCFTFLGYLPRKKQKITKTFEKCLHFASFCRTFIFYEAASRIVRSLTIFNQVFGLEKKVFLGQELTKIHEKGKLEKVTNLLKFYQENRARGEITVVFRV